ncbi:MAG: EAL domain-containing protein [Sulfurimonas sp.]|nr:EAL domain-containing protein [Sulfurimonas sp.]
MAILVGILVWWILLAHENRKRAEDELEEQYKKLQVSKQALLDQKNLYELVFKNTSSGILILDIDKDVVIDCNEAAVHILKYKSKAAILNHRPSEFSPEYQPDGKLSHDKVKEVIQIVKDKGYNSFEWKHLTSENKEVWIDVTLTSIELDGQKVLHTVWKDIDERKALQLKDAHQAQIIQQTNDSVISVDLDGNILTWNGGSEELFEYTADEAIGKNISMTYKKEDIYKLFKSFDMLISTGEYSADLSLVKKSHKLFDASVSLSLLKDEQGEPIAIVGYTQDITLRKETEKILEEQRKTLEYQAHYDALTGLPNRMLFQDRLLQGMEKSKRHSTQLALFFIDLDRFKQINDSLGHEVGDKVLQEVALRLKKTTRDEDSIARLGGDEFTIVMEDLARGENASVLARKILNTLSEALYIDEHTLYVSCSIGISLFPQDSTDSGKLIMYADAAMYKAKDEGKNNFQFYSSDMTNLAMKKVTLEVGLRKAIKNEEFIVYYQAQVDAVSGRTTGMEALVRWNHPDDGLISPALFIPIAEETGLIIELDQWVMKTAMNQFSSWYAQGLTPGVLAMNLSIKQLQKKGFISMFKGLMEETKCKAEWIELEVTESQIMTHPEDAIKILTKISELGIELAVDDFGTGYSSLSYLKKLPINKLKIDQTFVRGLPDDEEDAGITKAVIALAKSLSLRIIAEGVETKEQKDFLVENGCKSIQGYFYSKPIPAQEIDLMSIE